MSKLKEGAITALAEGANSSKSTLYAINEILNLENKIREAKIKKIEELNKQSQNKKKGTEEPINAKDLVSEAREYVDNDGMYRE